LLSQPKLIAPDVELQEFHTLTSPRTSNPKSTAASSSPTNTIKGVSFFGLFRYANAFDWACIIVAMLASFATGFCQVYLILALATQLTDKPNKNESSNHRFIS
jgi:hypothetical protein